LDATLLGSNDKSPCHPPFQALLIHGMNQQRLEVTKLTLKLADSNWEIFNSYPNSARPGVLVNPVLDSL
jgi:hypothetical protein